jgi:hypothetical protein
MRGALAPSLRPTRALGLYAFVFGVAALALVAGAAAGLRLVLQPAPRHDHAAQANLGRPIPTSFGWVSVNQVVRLQGPNAAELVRFRNGVEAVQVSLTLTNLEGRGLTLSADQFDLRVDATGALIAPGIWALPYHPPTGAWAGKALFRFVVPRHGALSFVFRDPGRRRPTSIALGHAALAPAATLNLDSHPGHGSYP